MGLIRRPTKISRRVVAVDDGQCLARQMGLVNSPADVTLYFEILVSGEGVMTSPVLTGITFRVLLAHIVTATCHLTRTWRT